MTPRVFQEEELTSDSSPQERRDERDALLERQTKRSEIDPSLREIQKLRKQLELPPREFTEDEMFGPTALEDRIEERDLLREMVPLTRDIAKERKKLGTPCPFVPVDFLLH